MLDVGMGLYPVLAHPNLRRDWSSEEVRNAISQWVRENEAAVGRPREFLLKYAKWDDPDVQAKACSRGCAPTRHLIKLVGVLPVIEFSNGVVDLVVILHKRWDSYDLNFFWLNQFSAEDDIPEAGRESATKWDADAMLQAFGDMTRAFSRFA